LYIASSKTFGTLPRFPKGGNGLVQNRYEGEITQELRKQKHIHRFFLAKGKLSMKQ